LKLDRHTFLIYSVWDDRDNMFGAMRPYVRLQYDSVTTNLGLE